MWWEEKMRKAQECMIMTMTIHNWLELELLHGINDQNLQRRLLQEKDPTLKDMISIATQWQSAEDAVAQFIIENKMSENESDPEEANHISYGRTSNQRKGPVNGNLNSDHKQTRDEHQAQLIKSVTQNEHQIQLIKSVPRKGHPVQLIKSAPWNEYQALRLNNTESGLTTSPAEKQKWKRRRKGG